MRVRSRGRFRWCVAALALGCVREDPEHCKNRGGNAACAEIGGGPICSWCTADNHGCVDVVADASCRADASDTSAGEGSDTGTIACDAEGEDPACPESTPYCTGGTCSGCASASEDFCAGIAQAAPVCHATWGRCVECVDDSDCTDGVCDGALGCVECFEHAHCPSGACDLGRGTCFETVNYVNSVGCVDPGFGDIDEPWCELSTALEGLGANEVRAVIVRGGPYVGTVDLDGAAKRTAVIVGDGDVTLRANGLYGAIVSSSSTLYLHGVRIQGGVNAGLRCSGGSQVHLDDVVITEAEGGIAADNCEVIARRTQIYDNTGDALVLETGGSLRLESSFVVNNGNAESETHAIVSTEADVDIVYSTLVGNRGLPADGSLLAPVNLLCTGDAVRSIRNSVVVSLEGESIACADALGLDSMLDTEAVAGENVDVVATYQADWFADLLVADAHVRTPGSSPLAGRARWRLGDPRTDIDGDATEPTPGAATFAGADQP